VDTRGHDHPDGPRAGLGVAHLAQGHDLGAGLLHPVPPGDAQVEQAVGHIPRDLLGAQDADLVDARVVDRRLVLDGRGPVDGQVGRLEQVEGRAFERALGEHELQHPDRG
jgi:hypothetical protein